MPAVLRKILGSSTYFLICCGKCHLYFGQPRAQPEARRHHAVEEVSPAVSHLISRDLPFTHWAPATGVPFVPQADPARTYLEAFAPASSSVWLALPQTTWLVPYHPRLSSNVTSSEGPSLTSPVPPTLFHVTHTAFSGALTSTSTFASLHWNRISTRLGF